MKKLIALMFVLLAIAPRVSFADDSTILSQIYAGFVGNAKFAIESTTEGTSKPEFLVNFYEIGSVNGDHIAAVDSGILGTILPDTGKFEAAHWTTGGKLHLAPLIKSYVKLPTGWQFLSTLEIDARGSYDWTAHHPFYGLVAAYPFK